MPTDILAVPFPFPAIPHRPVEGRGGREVQSMNDEHGNDDDPSAGETDEEIIQRELEESDVDAERALVVLVGTLVKRHLDCERRKLERQRHPARQWGPPGKQLPPEQDRPNALTAAMDALFQNSRGGEQTFDSSPRPDLPAGDEVNVRRMLMRLLVQCQFLAERQAGMTDEDGDDDDGPPTHMRLVTE